MSLEEVEKKLYGIKKGEDSKKESENKSARQFYAPDSDSDADEINLKNKWQENPGAKVYSDVYPGDKKSFMDKLGVFTKIGFWIVIALVLAGGGFVYYFLSEYNKSKDLYFNVEAPSKIMIARPFEISIDLENKSEANLRDPKIKIKLPDGVMEMNNGAGRQIIDELIDELKPNELVKKKFELVVLKDEQSIKKIEVIFSYLPPNLNTVFEKSKIFEISVDQPAISLNLETPQKIFNREIFEMNIKYKNISDFDFEKAKIQIVYPSGFIFKESSLKPSIGNNIWDLEKFEKGKEGEFSVKGLLQGVDQSFFEIKGQAFVFLSNSEHLISEKFSTLSIASSPISLSIMVNNNPNFIAGLSNDLNYSIFYRNNTDVALSDVILKTKLKGEMFDFFNIQTTGFFDSINNILTWNAGNVPEFKNLPPQTEGRVDFKVSTKAVYPIKRLFDRNFTLKIESEISSPTVPYNVSSDKTMGLASLETKIAGNSQILSSANYISGSVPPKVNKTTNFRIKWQIKNYSTDVKDVKIRAFLQSGAKWLNVVKSNIETMPSYNERTGEVFWEIPKITATKGAIGEPIEATFEAQIIPNITQISQNLPVLSETTLFAIDEFTGQEIKSVFEALKSLDNVVN